LNRTYFNKSLFTNTFSRLKTTGIVFTLICIIISIITPINRYIQMKSNTENFYEGNIIGIIEITPVLLVFMFIGSMVLTFSAFSHLNTRKASDFFHSLANTKICTYISMGSAVLSWVYITIISTVLVTTLTYSMLGIAVNSTFPMYLILTYISCATLITAVCLIAVSVSGTAFTNIIVTGLILMLPRFITFIFKVAVTSIAFNSIGVELGVIFNYQYNLPFALVSSGLGLDNNMGFVGMSDIFMSKGAILYTFILALIYLVVGCFLFNKRKSEIAEKSAPNKILQHIYRMSLTLPILLIFVVMYAKSFNKSITSFLWYNGVSTMLIFAISLIVYFVYELITTKKVMNLLRAIPLYFVLVAFVFVLGATAKSIGEKTLNTIPLPSEVKSVSMTIANGNNIIDYIAVKTDDIKFEDTKMVDILCAALKNDVDNYKSGSSQFHDSGYTYGGYTLHLKNGEKVARLINLTEDEFFEIQDIKVQNREYKKALRELPKKSEIINIRVGSLTQKQSKEVWDCFVEESKTLNDEDFSMATDGMKMFKSDYDKAGSGAYNNKFISGISVEGNVGTKSYNSFYNLSKFTPKTTNLYISLISDSQIQEMKSESDRIINMSSQSTEIYDYRISFFGSEENKSKYAGVEVYGQRYDRTNGDPKSMTLSQSKQIFEIIKNSGFKKADMQGSFITINTNISGKDRWKQFFIALSEEEMDKIIAIYEKK